MNKSSFSKFIPYLTPLFLIIIIFRGYFSSSVITASDFPFIFEEKLKDFFSVPFIWDSTRMGERVAPFLFTYPPLFLFGVIGNFFGFLWAERIVWFFPFLVISFFSSRFLFKTLFPKNNFWFLSPLVFLFNTYILMIVGGGQMGMAISYALAPFILSWVIKFTKAPAMNVLNAIKLGFLLSAQVIFDPRVAYITLIAIFSYAVFIRIFRADRFLVIIPQFLIASLVVLGLHAYWIFPAILARNVSLPQGYESPQWVDFLSFAQFSNTFSLLHPFWPENFFGKIGFMKPEFLMLPIFAYLSLVFLHSKYRKDKSKWRSEFFGTDLSIIFFALLGLVGSFLAKGVNQPFGEVYLWLFQHFPGMSMFRDPTKFYVLIAISYSILIPFSVSNIYDWLRTNKQSLVKNYLSSIFVLLVISCLIFLLRPAWAGELTGTFKGRQMLPEEYVELKNFISTQSEFFRTLWVPRRQRFGFYSSNHPMLYSQELVSPGVCQPPLCQLADKNKKPKEVDHMSISETEILDEVRNYSLSYFKNPQAPDVLSRMGVKYIIVPYDSEGEIFLMDRKYSEKEREKYLEFLDNVSWLKKVNLNDKITVYETPGHMDRFFTQGNKDPDIRWKMINPTKYNVSVYNASEPFTLVFSETYDNFWKAKMDGKVVPSVKMFDTFNSFLINKEGDFDVIVEFSAQKYAYWGLIISLLTLAFSTSFIFLSSLTRVWERLV